MRFDARRRRSVCAAVSIVLASATAALALQVREDAGRFSVLILHDKTQTLGVATTRLETLPSADKSRAAWGAFRAAHGQDWNIHLDRRSGAPLLVEGRGVPLSAGNVPGLDGLAASVRAFVAANRGQLLADDAELVLDRDASGELTEGVWQVVFNRTVSGIPVAGQRYLFTIGRGNLVSFGASRWSRITTSPVPDLDAARAREVVSAYMQLTADDVVTPVDAPRLEFVAVSPAHAPAAGRYGGPVGAGYSAALVWRIALRVTGDSGTWVATVDAHTGEIRSFVDDTKYARVKGGVYPIGNDLNCPGGCEQAGYPMPFAKVTVNGASQNATTLGTFSCAPSAAIATTVLDGPYVKVFDQCGGVSQSVACNADIDLSLGPGTDCTVPDGASVGNTHAARSSFYHLNRVAEHARVWLPTRTWLSSQLPDVVNINASCNAYWDGFGVNFFKSSANCGNTGEIAGVFLHEWGHGLDQNDGGNFDNPSEAYGDVTAFMSTHDSCLGRGFRKFSNCGGYGNTCLSCRGVRDLDWDKRVDHVPSTPAGFGATHCAQGGGPCGLEEHCEGYIAAEALWDLATRDLPASGLDAGTAWQLADKLWYKSRLGSGNNAYNCSLPDSDGCGPTSWYTKLRLVDDDDGNLANGTPHAAAIFAAFDRHAIACGTAAEPTNLNSATCPVLTAPSLTGTAGSGSATLTWTPVAGSVGYRIFRNDAGCDAATTRLSVATGSTSTDPGLVNGLTLYYGLQAIASNAACDGPMSNCVAVTPQPGAGALTLDSTLYACSGHIGVTVADGNVATSTVTVTFTSTTETVAEAITLTRVSPGSATFAGGIDTTDAPPAADGKLSIADGNTITARYVDANDGLGHTNQQRLKTATADCGPIVSGARPVPDGSFGTAMTGARVDPSGATIDVSWDVATCTSLGHHLLYGPLANVATATFSGAVCNLGASGTATWEGVPEGDLWFVVVGDDALNVEGSWGTDGTGAQRGGSTASGLCGLVVKDISGVCP